MEVMEVMEVKKELGFQKKGAWMPKKTSLDKTKMSSRQFILKQQVIFVGLGDFFKAASHIFGAAENLLKRQVIFVGVHTEFPGWVGFG